MISLEAWKVVGSVLLFAPAVGVSIAYWIFYGQGRGDSEVVWPPRDFKGANPLEIDPESERPKVDYLGQRDGKRRDAA